MKTRLIPLFLIMLFGISLTFISCTKEGEEVGDANLTGLIVNSQTGYGLANATLYFKSDLSATDYENADYVVTTDGSGYFTLTNAVSGQYIIFVVADGFFVRTITGINITSGDNTMDAITLVDAPNEGSFRIVLTWGASPEDLDSHLTGPDGSGGRFHMYYDNQNPNQYISLDVDDTDSYGPETTTITSFFNGTYRFSVHNYTDRYTASAGSGIVSSPAKIELYSSTGLLNAFTPPTFSGNGDTWVAFEIEVSGTNATINTINTYTLATDDDNINDFKNGNGKAAFLNMQDF